MEIILLEKYKKANIGDTIIVKDGFARNYLIPNKKAVQATAANKKVFEEVKEKILKESEAKRSEAEAMRSSIEGKHLYLVKQAGVDDRLYGSVTATDIVDAIKEQVDQSIKRSSVTLSAPIKYLGTHDVTINLFADITATVHLVIARTKEEAEAHIASLQAETSKSSN